jgi:hypothetical protein
LKNNPHAEMAEWRIKMKRVLLALSLLFAISAYAATTYTVYNGAVTPTAKSTPYCLAAAPTVIVGAYIPSGQTTIVTAISGVGSYLTITDHDANGVAYVGYVDTSVANTTKTSGCSVH